MKKTEKAFLLSVLVFPGTGHVLLKRYIAGFSIIIIALAASYFVIYGLINQALEIADKIKSGETSPDLSVILELLSHQSASAEVQSINTSMVVLLVAWLVGVVDSYRVGWYQNKAANAKAKCVNKLQIINR